VRLRHPCTIATTVLLFGVLTAVAQASSGGGTSAPVSATGSSGTTGLTGATGSSVPTLASNLAPIKLAKGQSPTAVYTGPVFELTPVGIVAYSSLTPTAASDVVDGGTTATASSSAGSSALPKLLVPGNTAEEVEVDGLGLAAAPEDAPTVVQDVIWAANAIIGRPYVYGGGHKSFKSYGYDCSGTVSYALHGGKLLKSPLDSSQFEGWGAGGQGQWMTILTNPSHAYIDVAGLRLDTSPENDPSGLNGPRWRVLRPTNAGYVKRHPFGL
jgi:cell wall-associated NlpC family hydrolase